MEETEQHFFLKELKHGLKKCWLKKCDKCERQKRVTETTSKKNTHVLDFGLRNKETKKELRGVKEHQNI